MLPIRTVLHATDMSECSKYAYQLACSIARDYNAKLILVNVVPFQGASMGTEGMVIPPPVVNSDQLRDELTKLAKHAGLPHTGIVLADGDPSDEILRVAKENKCDLIVMGTHGRRGLGRLVMGSVAEQVLRRAMCPVLTVKTPDKEAIATKPESTATKGAIPGGRVTT
jgi:nucleotide-binding universal stress UspA family protein